jgi:PAS domain S-box-containing protein
VRRRKSGHSCEISLSVSPIKDEDGRIIGASKIARDITEYKRAQRVLYESQERWRVTLASIGDAVLATDAQGHVTFANVVALKLLGRAEAGVMGRPLVHVFNIVNEHTRATVGNPVDRVLRDGVIVGLANHTLLIRPDGSEVPIDDSAAPIFDHEGHLIGVILIFRDITQRKDAESKLQRWSVELEARVHARTQELVHSQERLRGLASQLSSAERRERRRLANSLHDYLAQLLALARMKVSQTTQRLIATPVELKTSLTELDDILQQSLAFTRSLMAQLSPSVLHDLGFVSALHWLAEQMKQQGLTVEVRVISDDQLRLEDNEADMLFQAIRELLLNVIKHAGILQATVVVDRDDTNSWLIAVHDSGRGFEVGALPHRPSASGERFGLFSIQERMELMSGHCVIDSTPGRGTTVKLSLPITRKARTLEASQSPATIEQETAPRPAGTRWRVLLVDDHVMVRQGLHSILESYADLEVVAVAADGEEAVEYALHHQPDVILMDINLPRLNGIEATRRIKQRAPHILVIGLSVQTSAQTTEALLEAGGATLLSKEQAADDLYRTITQLLRGN